MNGCYLIEKNICCLHNINGKSLQCQHFVDYGTVFRTENFALLITSSFSIRLQAVGGGELKTVCLVKKKIKKRGCSADYSCCRTSDNLSCRCSITLNVAINRKLVLFKVITSLWIIFLEQCGVCPF